jgi:predicted permease
VLLKPLPYPQADRLVFLWSTWVAQGIPSGGSSLPDYRDWRDQNQTFERLAAYYSADLNVSGAGLEPERVEGAHGSANLFRLLGVAPALGRDFLDGEDTWGRHRVAILSDAFWQRRFGGDPAVLRRTITIGGEPFAIVGVMPPRMPFFDDHPVVDLWTPIALPPGDSMDTRDNHYVNIVGRLRPGVAIEQARADMATLARQFEDKYPHNRGLGTLVEPVQDRLTRDVKPALLLLLAAVGFVLLIACVNVAGLLLARAAGRQRELAVRASLGATRWRLIRQLAAENIALAIFGGAAGLLVALWSLAAFNPRLAASLPRFNALGLNGRVFLFTLVLSLLSSLLFGLIPAWQATRADLREALNQDGRGDAGGGRQRARLRGALVAVQMALAIILLAGAGLMLRSFLALRNVDAGVAREHVLTMRIPLPEAKYRFDDTVAGAVPPGARVFDEVVRRVRELPEVRAAGLSTSLPLGFGDGWGKLITVEGRPPARTVADVPIIQFALAGSGYFSASGITLRSGRTFDDRDTGASLPVAIVNEAFVRRFLAGQEPIGHHIRTGLPEHLAPAGFRAEDRPVQRTIVGVIGDVKDRELDRPAAPTVFAPLAQHRNEGWFNTLSLAIRTSSDPSQLVAPVRAQMRAVDPDQPITQVQTMEALLERGMERPRFGTMVMMVFAVVALTLAAVGLFGVISYLVTLRTSEMGLRMALGAGRGDVLRLVLWQGLRLACVGVALGIAGALALMPLLRSYLYGVGPADAATLVATALLGLLVTLIASYLPARRATRIDPLKALRSQ